MKKRSTGLNSILKSDSPNQSRMGLTEDDLFSSINLFNKRVDDSHNENSLPQINSLYQKRQMIGVENKNFFDYLKFNYDKEKLLINRKQISKNSIEELSGMKKISFRVKVAQNVLSARDLDTFYLSSVDAALNAVLPKIANTTSPTHIPTQGIGPLHGGGESVKWMGSIFSGYENNNFKKISQRDNGNLFKIAIDSLPSTLKDYNRLGRADDIMVDNVRSLFKNKPDEFLSQYRSFSKPQQDIIKRMLGADPLANLTSIRSATPAPAPAGPTPTPTGPAQQSLFGPPKPPAGPAQQSLFPPKPPSASSILDDLDPSKPIKGKQLPLFDLDAPKAPDAPTAPTSTAPKPPSASSILDDLDPSRPITGEQLKLPFNNPPKTPDIPNAGGSGSMWQRFKGKQWKAPSVKLPGSIQRFIPKTKGGKAIAIAITALVADEVLSQSAAITYGQDLAKVFDVEFRKMVEKFRLKNSPNETFGQFVSAKIASGMQPKDAVDIWFDELLNRGVPEVFSGSDENPFISKVKIYLKGLWNILSFGSGEDLTNALTSECLSHANDAVSKMKAYILGKVSGPVTISTVPSVSGPSTAMTATPAPTASIPSDPAWTRFDAALKANGAKILSSGISEVRDLWNQKVPKLQMVGGQYDYTFASYQNWYNKTFPSGVSGTVPDQIRELKRIS